MTAFRLWALLLLAVPAAKGGGVTWTDRGASTIKRMNFDGSGLVTVPVSGGLSSPGSNLRGIALDPAGGRMFWADNGADRILRANLDGSSTVILASLPTGFPADVRVDPATQRVFFCDQQRNLLQRMGYDGTALTTVIDPAGANQPYFLEVVPGTPKVYWGGFVSGSIYRANTDGTAVETIITGNNTVRGVCLDTAGGMIYWINRDDKKVHRCALSALPVNVTTSPAVQTLYQGLDTPHGLALDLPARKLYWADTGSNTGLGVGDKAVSRGDIDGATPQEVLAAGSEPWDADIDPRCNNYAEWRARYFRKDAPVGVTAPDADPDKDGSNNLLEYAGGSHPLRADLQPVRMEGFIFRDAVTGFPHLALRYYRRPAATDLSYYVQVSTNLSDWRDSRSAGIQPTVVEVSSEPAPDYMLLVTSRAEARFDTGVKSFLRVSVELRP